MYYISVLVCKLMYEYSVHVQYVSSKLFRRENPLTKSGFGINLARGLVLSKLRTRLGLNETRYFITGAAPISKDTQEFFLSLNMPLLEAFGMSETTGILLGILKFIVNFSLVTVISFSRKGLDI